MPKTIYFESLFSGLIPVDIISVDPNNTNVHLKVKQSHRAYNIGEELTAHRWNVVYKTRVSNGHQVVTELTLDELRERTKK